jgi:hypothetical protein
VVSQVRRVIKGSATYLTSIGPSFGVCQEVSFVVGLDVELFATKYTDQGCTP